MKTIEDAFAAAEEWLTWATWADNPDDGPEPPTPFTDSLMPPTTDWLASALLALRPVWEIAESLAFTFDQAVAAHDPTDPRHRSHGGQHTNGPCCEFGNLNPGAVRAMRWWARELRAAIDAARKEQP